tara:strand:- start:1129 stop:1569 length:441 start_codon:yes stop_codon:yes gene_type:complete
MLKSFNNKKNIQDQNIDLVKIVSLLIHAAKIDENYTEKEKKLILKFIPIFLKENNEKNILESELDVFEKAEKYESASNQILEFTKEAKKIDLKLKKLIIQTLWEIVLSDDKSGIYESNLMRRICGLLYIPDQLSGEIKINILNRKK